MDVSEPTQERFVKVRGMQRKLWRSSEEPKYVQISEIPKCVGNLSHSKYFQVRIVLSWYFLYCNRLFLNTRDIVEFNLADGHIGKYCNNR